VVTQSLTNLLHVLFRRPASKTCGSKVTCIFNKLNSKAGFWVFVHSIKH